MHKGRLRVRIIDSDSSKPISNAKVIIKNHEAEKKEDIEVISSIVKEFSAITNNLGYTRRFELETCREGYVQNSEANNSFSLWDIWIKASGYKTCVIKGIEIFSGIISEEICRLKPLIPKENTIDIINVLPNTMFINYPPKVPELAEEIENGELKRLYRSGVLEVPQRIVVHNGLPEDNTAFNYTVGVKDYIKNVACSSMNPNWDENSLRAGVISIISFTLNRLFSQHYRKAGKMYDITSSTAYDQLFAYGRSVHLNISKMVDELWPMYIVKSGQMAPLLVQCCNGIGNEYPGWFSYWRSHLLGQQGKSTKSILKSLLGEDIEVYSINKIEREMRNKALYRYRSFSSPVVPYSATGVRLRVSYPEDV